jgi:signal transduction histidine kinase
MVRSTLIPPRHRIRVQVMFWTSALLFIAMVVPLELRLQIDQEYLVQDLTDRSREVLNDVAAELSSMEFPEEDVEDVQDLVLREVHRVPSIVELSVFQDTPAGTRLIASTVKPEPDVTPERMAKLTAQPLNLTGSNGEHLTAMSRGAPNQPGVTIIAVTNEEELDRFNSFTRNTAYGFTLAGIAAVLLILNYIFKRKIGQPLDEILTVMEKAHVGDYSERVPQAREDETGQVAQTLNELLDRVEIRSEEKNRLIAEATRGMLESQNRLLQSERLATAGQMAATFAHEIGSPLTSLSAHAELLLEDPETAPHQKEALALMHKQIRRVTQIVDDLLRSARRGPEDFVPINAVEIVTDVLKLVLPRLQAQNITVNNRLPETLPVRGYALYLQEIFLNLINNSAEAIERNGAIEIAGGLDPAGKIWIEVRDNGPGIDPQIVDDVWKQFVTTKAMRKGTGLGLAVVRDIVKQHGGEISLQTSPAGTAIRVVLPALKDISVPVA